MTILQQYQKLKPFLKVCVLDKDSGRAHRLADSDRQMLYVRCPRDYLWGSYHAGLNWDPSPVTRQQNYLQMRRPTYEQFCTWYKLDLEAIDDQSNKP